MLNPQQRDYGTHLDAKKRWGFDEISTGHKLVEQRVKLEAKSREMEVKNQNPYRGSMLFIFKINNLYIFFQQK